MIELTSTTRLSTAPPSEFFARWVDHSTWSQWSPDSEWVRLEGPVAVGAPGSMKLKNGPTIRFRVSECEPDRVYTDVSAFPGARLTFRHTAEPDSGGARLGVRVSLDGPLARLWAMALGRGFRASAPADLDRLVAIVEGGR